MDEETKMRIIIVFEIILLIVILVGEFFFFKVEFGDSTKEALGIIIGEVVFLVLLFVSAIFGDDGSDRMY